MHPTSNYWLRIFVVGFVVLCTLYLFYYLFSTLRPAQATGPTSTSIPTPVPTIAKPDFTKFVGTWYGHGRTLTFAADGGAYYDARVYQWCAPGVPPPCDSMQGNDIIGGITETMVFTRVNGSTAYGTITASTDGKARLPVSLTLEPHDTLDFSAGLPLCGPQSPPGECGA